MSSESDNNIVEKNLFCMLPSGAAQGVHPPGDGAWITGVWWSECPDILSSVLPGNSPVTWRFDGFAGFVEGLESSNVRVTD